MNSSTSPGSRVRVHKVPLAGSLPEVCGLYPFEWARLAAEAPSIEAAFDSLSDRLMPLAFDRFALVIDHPLRELRFPARPRRLGALLSDEFERLLERDTALASADPLARRFMQSQKPLYLWPGSDLAQAFSDSEKTYLDLYSAYGLRSAIVMPMHDRRTGRLDVAMIADTSCGWLAREISRSGGDSLHTSLTFFSEGLRVRQLAQRGHPVLSRRERDCLAWCAAGCTTQAIADRLSLSDSTVNEYIASAVRKLGATNRTQACARAMLLSLVS